MGIFFKTEILSWKKKSSNQTNPFESVDGVASEISSPLLAQSNLAGQESSVSLPEYSL